MVLKRISRPKEEVVRRWRRVQSGEFHNLHISPNIIRIIKPKSVRWEGHVACMGVMVGYCENGNEPLGSTKVGELLD
jgi:hypothetical protein